MQVLLGCRACGLRVQAQQAVGAAPDIAQHNGQAGRPLRSRVLRLRVGGLHSTQRHAPKLLCHPIGRAGSAPTTAAAAAASCCCCSKLGSGGEGLVTAAAFDRLGVLPVTVTAVCQEGQRAQRVSKGWRQAGKEGEMPPTWRERNCCVRLGMCCQHSMCRCALCTTTVCADEMYCSSWCRAGSAAASGSGPDAVCCSAAAPHLATVCPPAPPAAILAARTSSCRSYGCVGLRSSASCVRRQ